MILKNKKYKSFDVLLIVLRASPIYTILRVIFLLIFATVPTVVTALVTANFIDTATEVLQGTRPNNDIYLPFILLLVTLAAITIMGSLVNLITSKINFDLHRKLKPTMVEINAALDYKHIENIEIWELISRVTRDPVGSILFLVSRGFCVYSRLL